jgi:hypothetical protein
MPRFATSDQSSKRCRKGARHSVVNSFKVIKRRGEPLSDFCHPPSRSIVRKTITAPFSHVILTDGRGIPRIALAAEAVCVGPFPVRHFSEAIMKSILSAALVLGLCGLASARDDKADPVGTWKCEYEIGGQKRMSTLMIKKDGDKLAGTMNWPDQKDAKLKDVKLKDGTLTFSAEREIMDNKLTVEYKLMIDGDKFKGKVAVDIGGQKQEIDIEGKREKKDK